MEGVLERRFVPFCRTRDFFSNSSAFLSTGEEPTFSFTVKTLTLKARFISSTSKSCIHEFFHAVWYIGYPFLFNFVLFHAGLQILLHVSKGRIYKICIINWIVMIWFWVCRSNSIFQRLSS